jgi:hypothetical protein
VNDEYDVQYLLRSLLFIEFDDVRDEDPVPSRGGAPSRVDFLIAEERVVVEVKMVRKGLSDKKLGEELIVDIDRYRAHPTCDRLFCFVYDPDHLLRNPRGLERDLSQTLEGLDVFVFVRPISDWSAKV